MRKATQTISVSFWPTLAAVVGLLFDSGPAAIAWFIISVVILSIKRKTDRLKSHIHEEIFKGLNPTWAYSNSPATVIFIVFGFFVVASSLHVAPREVFSASHRTPFVAMAKSCEIFTSKTTTTQGTAMKQMFSHNRCFVPADTFANPVASMWCIGNEGAFDYLESSKRFTC
jgi:hypothetical protein